MSNKKHSSDYIYNSADFKNAHQYLVPKLEGILKQLGGGGSLEIFDLGCGNGAVAAYLSENGHEVTGVDPSSDGIREARSEFPDIELYVGSAYDNLSEEYGNFEVVLSVEVIEHVYYPRDFAETLFNLVEPGGHAIISTPYHGYWKNLAIAVTGKWGKTHYSPLWRNGHIKIWSFETLEEVLREVGFEEVSFYRVGRIPPFAKSMIALGYKAE